MKKKNKKVEKESYTYFIIFLIIISVVSFLILWAIDTSDSDENYKNCLEKGNGTQYCARNYLG